MFGFIGCGNMASAIIKGIVKSGFMQGNQIAVYDKDNAKCEALSKEYSVKIFSSENEIAEKCTAILLAVKPNVLSDVLLKIKDTVKEKYPLCLSIAAGKSIEFIQSALGFEARIIRIMPNINAVALEAICAYCGSEKAGEDDLAFAKSLCESFGKAVKIEEEKFSAYSAVGGCAPAFSYMFIDSLARAAVRNGMTKSDALFVAAQTVLGSAKMILESDEHPWELVDKVCSPAGTTIEGVLSLEENGFENAVMQAVISSFEKDRNM